MTNHDALIFAPLLGQALQGRGLMLACAESCTGGLLAAAMTDTPGASQWFERGFVTYSNAAKIQHLHVGADTLERFGAVSEETAMEMASGVLTVSTEADVAISITGVAGPDGGTPGKPVGMVCFGFAQRASDGVVTRAVTRIFEGGRSEVRHAAVAFAISSAMEFMAVA